MNYKLKPGYAYQWDGISGTRDNIECPRTQEWEITVFFEGEYPSPEYVGKRSIDGSLCVIFFVGRFRGLERFIAQTAVHCQGTTTRQPVLF
jgi:hypothetical protein